jgi:predicted nucleic acid-binding protein
VIGLDTSFLVAFEILEHPLCQESRGFALRHSHSGLSLAPQVLAEFIHVVSDFRRFSRPLSMEEALSRSYKWWNAREVHRVFPTHQTVILFNDWMTRYGLGRKRILDTMLAATYASAEITDIVSTDARDFSIFPSLTRISMSS